MRSLLPQPSTSIDPIDAYAVSPDVGIDRPFVRCNMISTLDGAISINGRSGLLGGRADHRIFQTLRSLADVILVGAGTVRTEGYGPVRLDDDLGEQRRERGQSVAPPIAVVTRSANLDWSSPFFTEADARPIVFTTADRDRGVRLPDEDVAHVVMAGDERVDVSLVLDYLHRSGLRSVLLEGGPGLNADVVHAGLLNELCLTVSPLILAGAGTRILAGAELANPLELELIHLLEEDGFFFYRFSVRQPQSSTRGAHDDRP
jgi:riboflavin biosynthesis pyrimidine reductase